MGPFPAALSGVGRGGAPQEEGGALPHGHARLAPVGDDRGCAVGVRAGARGGGGGGGGGAALLEPGALRSDGAARAPGFSLSFTLPFKQEDVFAEVG